MSKKTAKTDPVGTLAPPTVPKKPSKKTIIAAMMIQAREAWEVEQKRRKTEWNKRDAVVRKYILKDLKEIARTSTADNIHIYSSSDDSHRIEILKSQATKDAVRHRDEIKIEHRFFEEEHRNKIEKLLAGMDPNLTDAQSLLVNPEARAAIDELVLRATGLKVPVLIEAPKV